MNLVCSSSSSPSRSQICRGPRSRCRRRRRILRRCCGPVHSRSYIFVKFLACTAAISDAISVSPAGGGGGGGCLDSSPVVCDQLSRPPLVQVRVRVVGNLAAVRCRWYDPVVHLFPPPPPRETWRVCARRSLCRQSESTGRLINCRGGVTSKRRNPIERGSELSESINRLPPIRLDERAGNSLLVWPCG